MKKNLANIITFTRIIGTIIMAFFPVESLGFYITYTYSGLSDVLDGFIARKLNIQSDFGRKLDSISDLMFYTTMCIKIWPYMVKYLPPEVWALIWITFGIRLTLYLLISIIKKEMLANHTFLNKLSGAMLFVVPFTLNNSIFPKYAASVVSVTFISALYEVVVEIKKHWR